MERRVFIHTLGAATAGGLFGRLQLDSSKKLERIGLELYAVRHAMARDPEGTLARARHRLQRRRASVVSRQFRPHGGAGCGRTQREGLRAPSAHVSSDILVMWNAAWRGPSSWARVFIVPASRDTRRTIVTGSNGDRFNAAGAIARRAGVWVAFITKRIT